MRLLLTFILAIVMGSSLRAQTPLLDTDTQEEEFLVSDDLAFMVAQTPHKPIPFWQSKLQEYGVKILVYFLRLKEALVAQYSQVSLQAKAALYRVLQRYRKQ